MKNTSLVAITVLALFAASSTACAVPTSSGDDEPAQPRTEDGTIGTAQSAVTALGFATISATNNSLNDVDLGLDSNRTCWLTQISGQLKGSSAQPALASVFRSGGRWFLRVRSGTGTGLTGTATCSAVTTGRKFIPETDGFVATAGGAQCFLREVSATSGFQTASNALTVGKQMVWPYSSPAPFEAWAVKDTLWNGAFGEIDGGSAKAVCITTPVYHAWEFQGFQSHTLDIDPNINCGLLKVGGAFIDGGNVDVTRIGSAHWTTTASAGRTVGGQCI